jgi:hypothetical protein
MDEALVVQGEVNEAIVMAAPNNNLWVGSPLTVEVVLVAGGVDVGVAERPEA